MALWIPPRTVYADDHNAAFRSEPIADAHCLPRASQAREAAGDEAGGAPPTSALKANDARERFDERSPELSDEMITTTAENSAKASAGAARPYCPSRYGEAKTFGSPATNGTAANRLKAQIRALQEHHSRHAADAARAAGVPIASCARAPPSSLEEAPKDDRLASILSFLDEVEETSRADDIADAAGGGAAVGFAAGGLAAPSQPGVVGPWPGTAADALALQTRISLLDAEVRDKRSIIEALKRALAEAKEREQHLAQEVEKECEEKLQRQKDHYEAGLERHLKLVDRLLNDKNELTKRCELFTEELKAVERRFQMKMEELDEQASKDLQRQKQNWMAAEKVRRQAWEKDKVVEIKEMTIKGLQPEVERILAERKQERHRQDDQHREMLESQRRDLEEREQKQLRELREQLLKERDVMLAEERELHRQKVREEFERFEANLREERAKCAAEVVTERRRAAMEKQRATEADEAEHRSREALESLRASSEVAVREARHQLGAAEERHHCDVEALQSKHLQESERMKREHELELKEKLERSEAALREHFVRERDHQIEVLTERLSRDQIDRQRELKQEASTSLEAAKSEAREMERRLSAQLEESRGQTAVLQTQTGLLQQQLQGLQTQLDQMSARCSSQEERARALEEEKLELRRECEDRIERQREDWRKASEAQELELASAKGEKDKLSSLLAEEKARAEAQLSEAARREEKVIAELEARVKRTVQVKEGALQETRARCVAAENKVREFEYLLARQREELLGGLTKA